MVPDKTQSRVALSAVAVGVLAVSAAAIFIRLAEALAVAFWRCALGMVVLPPPALAWRERFFFVKGQDVAPLEPRKKVDSAFVIRAPNSRRNFLSPGRIHPGFIGNSLNLLRISEA